MKKTAFALLISLILFTATGCKENDKGTTKERADSKNVIDASKVPDQVKNAFSAKYPGAGEIIWETAHEKDMDTYKVKFKQDTVYMKAEFSTDGKFIKENKDN